MTDVDLDAPTYDWPTVSARKTRTSPTIGAFATALAAAQAAAKHPGRNRENPHFRNKYADLAAVIDAGKVLAENGIAVLPTSTSTDGRLVLTLLLVHGESGEWAESDLEMSIGKQDAQGVAGTLTYLRRYALSMVCNIASEEDDDGNTASRPPAPPTASQAPQEPKLLTARQVEAVLRRAPDDGASVEDVSRWVHEATQGRTVNLEEMFDHEVPALRAEREAWLARTGTDGESPPAPTLALETERTP